MNVGRRIKPTLIAWFSLIVKGSGARFDVGKIVRGLLFLELIIFMDKIILEKYRISS